MLARKQGPRACGAVPRIGPLLTLLAPVLLLVSASHIEAARNTCDSACRECKTSCASQKVDCLTHARADRTSALGDCTRPFRALVPKTRTPDARACAVRVQAERNSLPLLLQGKWQRWL